MTDLLLNLRFTLRTVDYLDIAIVAFIVYRVLVLIKGTRAMQMLTGLGILGLGFFLSSSFELYTTHWILSYFFDYLILIVIVLFQDDLRRALTHVGKNPFFSGASDEEEREVVDEIATAVFRMVKTRTGGLVVIERETSLKNFIDTGSQLDSKVKSELMTSIIVVAIVLWFVVLGSRSIEVTKDVPLEVVTSEEMTVANEIPDRITFRLSGPKAFMRAILNRSEPPIRVNLEGNSNASVTYRFFSDNIRVPPGVKVLGVSPPAIQIRQEPVRSREVNVRADLRGIVPEGYKIVKIRVEPATVKIRGAKSRLATLSEIPTAPWDVSELRASQVQVLPLEVQGGVSKIEGGPVRVTVEVATELMRYRVKGVPVRVIADGAFRIQEPMLHLVVLAHFEQLKLISAETPVVQVDVRGKSKGQYELVPQVSLPRGVTLVRTIPSKVHVTLP
jgi:YbbR domain-containing protein